MARRISFAVLILWSIGIVASLAVARDAAATDPVDDPWLAEQGPAVPETVEIPRERVFGAWQAAPDRSHARAAALHRLRLEAGLGNLVAPAHLVLADSSAEEPEVFAELAADLAPGLPSIQISRARALWQAGDIGAAVGAIGRAVWALGVDLALQLWLIENVAFMLLIVVLSASIAFLVLACLKIFSHAAHDLGDVFSNRMPGFARTAALAGLLLLPLCLGEGVLGVALALFAVAFWYGTSHQRSVLVMAGMLLVIGLHPLAQLLSAATTVVEKDPVLSSVMAVVSATETQTDVERLERVSEEDLAAAHALAYRARRYGQIEYSRELLDGILERYPDDVVALTNRGNIEMRRGNTEGAIAYYERAVSESDSPALLFDLSQAYASAFRMEEYETTLQEAQRLGDRQVAALSGFGDAALVADLEYPMALIRSRLITLALAQNPKLTVAEVLAPGHLGERWFVTASAFALVALLGLLFADRFDHASLCTRCGHRICTRCEETVWSEEICEDCHHLFKYPEATDPSLRMARLQALSERDARIDRVVLAISLLVPGMAGFAAHRPDLAMFGLLLFASSVVWAIWPTGAFQDPLMLGGGAAILFAIPGSLALLGYAGVTCASFIARKNR